MIADGGGCVSNEELRKTWTRNVDVWRRYYGHRTEWFGFLYAVSMIVGIMAPLMAIPLMVDHRDIASGLMLLTVLNVVLRALIEPKREQLRYQDLYNSCWQVLSMLIPHPDQPFSSQERDQIEKSIHDLHIRPPREMVLPVLMARAENEFCDANTLARKHKLRWWHRLTSQTNLFAESFPSILYGFPR